MNKDWLAENRCCALRLFGLDQIRLQLCAKHSVPESGGDAKAKVVLEEVVFQVVLLELLVPERQILVVKEVMGHVIADVAEDAATIDCRRSVPVVGEESVGEIPEGSCEHQEHGRRHDKPVLVHRQIVVNAVEQEVRSYAISVVRKVAVP